MKKSEVIKIFESIDRAIEETRSDHPVTIEESRFIKRYNKIKRRYLNE